MDKPSVIQWSDKKPDGTRELTYLGNVVGWALQAQRMREMGDWIAMSVHGHVRHVCSLNAAKAALMEMYC